MPTQKIDPKVIFASDAPAIDKPPVFSDKTKGWDVSRANDGRPTIKEMNKVQQDTDLKILWLNENSVAPHDESIDYPDGAVTIKDSSFKQLVSGAWVEFLDDFADKDAVKRGIANRYDSSLTYNSGERVVLTNGDIVKSAIDGNTNDPNVNMTGWVKTNLASQIFDEDGLSQQDINNKQKERNKYEINARDWGVLPSNSPEVNSANWFALNNAFPERPALDIFVPIGNYNFSGGFYITRPHHIRGVGVGELSKTIFNFAGATPVGTVHYKSSIFIIHSSTAEDTSGNGATLPVGQIGTSGTGAVIDFIKVTGSSEHGIIKNAPSYLNGVASMNNAKHGILTIANTGGSRLRISGVANQGSNTECAALFNGWSGIVEIGDDANVIKNDNCLAAYNSQFGFYDASLLGGTNISGQSHENTLGDYCMQGSLYDNSGLPETPSRTVWISTYAENARPQSYSMNYRSLIIGYTGAPPYPHNINVLSSSVVGMAAPKAFSVTEGVQWVQAGKGGDFVSIKKNAIDFGFTANPAAGFSISNLSDPQKIMALVNGYNAMSFFLQNISATLQQNRPWFPNGLTMGTYHHQSVGTTSPSSGEWERGNIVWNEAPLSGGKIGWVCVASGSPGTWKPFGTIDS